MAKQTTTSSHRDKLLIISGFISIAILFMIYSRFETIAITDNAISVMQRIAITFYIIIFLAFIAIGIGLYKFHKRKSMETKSSLLEIIAVSYTHLTLPTICSV